MTWILLAAALLCGFLPGRGRAAAAPLLIMSLALAVYHHFLAPAGVAVLAVIALVMAARRRYRHHRVGAAACELFLLLCCLGLFMHLLPGFHNPRIINDVRLGPASAPFTLYLNLDKALTPVMLLACLPNLVSRAVSPVPRYYWAGLILAIPALLGLATVLGGLRPEAHWPSGLGWFALSNLFFVALPEEALFRGYLLQRFWDATGSRATALAASSLLFGLAHVAGGGMLVFFSALAGVLYGLVWLWSGKLWLAALFHFLLNLTHLLFFTYPFYQPAG
ncbi:CPBP family intramembrane glutamic endopeptidase [Martelella alba]|uniref:CPBP family intramembrane metalloprotease n=1 Tax=Martelella alba TaxID=2590451 RepID=A0ABY2SEU5_9HYPH|nr:CPBP family intramembrane glutamic endopeptidase [Martelella alba]TKI02953.1 CPBP family intramembrane metalloprotease [Martelella alba]